jgi:steroid delta-isomerase-like uncharacterized protein
VSDPESWVARSATLIQSDGEERMTQHHEIASQFYESFAAGDIDSAVAVFADHLETVDPGMGTVVGLPKFREYLEGFKRAMPDARAVISRMYEADDTIIVEGRLLGTHTGPLAGPDGDVEPSGRTIDVPFADFSRIQDGKIVAYHTYYDQISFLTQLGLMPESAG